MKLYRCLSIQPIQGPLCIASILFAILLHLSLPAYSEGLVYTNEHWPPWVIDNKSEPAQLTGIDLDIVAELADRLGMHLTTNRCVWRRCLKRMKLGNSDILSSLSRTEEREEYIHFLEPPYIETASKAFYLRVDSDYKIENYEDIYNYTVGVVDGNKYFPKFDNDTKVTKIYGSTVDLLPKMLQRKRFGVLLELEMVMDYLIREQGLEGHFKKATYKVTEPYEVYLGLSRKSAYAKDLDRFNRALAEMKDQGVIKDIMHKNNVKPY